MEIFNNRKVIISISDEDVYRLFIENKALDDVDISYDSTLLTDEEHEVLQKLFSKE